jgi:hypothetical protein
MVCSPCVRTQTVFDVLTGRRATRGNCVELLYVLCATSQPEPLGRQKLL